MVGVGRGVLNTVGKGFAVAGGVMSTVDRLQEGQTAKQALVGATGETVGAWYGFGAGMKLGSAVTAKVASPLLFAPFPGADATTFGKHKDDCNVLLVQAVGKMKYYVEGIGPLDFNPGDGIFISKGVSHSPYVIEPRITLSFNW